MGGAALPRPRPHHGRRALRFLLVGAGWLLLGHSAGNLFYNPRWHPDLGSPSTWWPTAPHDETLWHGVQLVMACGDAAFALWYVLLAARRLRHISLVEHWVYAPMTVSVLAAAMPLAVRPAALLTDSPLADEVMSELVNGVLVLVPVAFIVVLVRQGVTRSVVADLVVDLTRDGRTIDVTDALRVATRDPHLVIRYWVPETDEFVDASGVRVPPPTADRAALPVRSSDGALLAELLVDPRLTRDAGLVDAVLAASTLTLENTRLRAALSAQLEEVRASRRRIAEAGVEERRRLERDLHDGVQQRLLALTLRLADMRATGVAGPAVIDGASEELHLALAELRELARGIHPTALVQGGLGPALEDVVDRLRFPVELEVVPRRWPPAIEATAYFVVCEALSNVVKHSRAGYATVVVTDGEDGTVRLHVADDGCGGAAVVPGGGVSGVGDRVRAVGGDLSMDSPPGGGTSLTVRLPCA